MTNPADEATVLVIDDDAEIRYSLERVLGTRNYNVHSAASGKEGIAVAKKVNPQVVFLDNRMEGMSGIETLQHLRSANRNLMVILMTAFGTTQTAIEAMKFGAYDYIVKPFDIKRVFDLTETAFKAYADLVKSTEYEPLLNSEDYKEGMVGTSESMREVFKVIGQVAASDVTVMITGESGTGKELVARSLVQHSLRSERPFIAVNCAAIPENLIESELFGHEKGSFTGATTQRQGKFELCDGGTIFLDEIGDMALQTQTRILRALQEGEIQRVGGSGTIKVDVRLIAATNKNLEKMVEEKTFREDLYYRLNVVRIRMPSLRERLSDVPELVDFMLQRMAKDKRSRMKHVSPEAMEILCSYSWPGNVRELENVIQRSAVVAQGDSILGKDLPLEVRKAVAEQAATRETAEGTDAEESEMIGKPTRPPFPGKTPPPQPDAGKAVAPPTNGSVPPASAEVPAEQSVSASPAAPKETGSASVFDSIYTTARKDFETNILHHIEREMIVRALAETGSNQVKTAAILGITRATLRKRIEQFELKL